MGAAEYIVKPFSQTELFESGELAIHFEERRLTLAGLPVWLTAIEYKLLRALSVNAGRTATYESLSLQVWGRRETSDSRTVRAFVIHLRQ